MFVYTMAAEGLKFAMKIVFLIIVAVAIFAVIYFLKDILYDKSKEIMKVFSAMFDFS